MTICCLSSGWGPAAIFKSPGAMPLVLIISVHNSISQRTFVALFHCVGHSEISYSNTYFIFHYNWGHIHVSGSAEFNKNGVIVQKSISLEIAFVLNYLCVPTEVSQSREKEDNQG